jgi:hypothetical protein
MIVVCIDNGDIVDCFMSGNEIRFNSPNPFYTDENCIVTTWEHYVEMVKANKWGKTWEAYIDETKDFYR